MKRKEGQTKLLALAAKKQRSAAKVEKATAVSAKLKRLAAVAINLKSRPDRWHGLQRSVAKNAPWLQLKRLDAVNGKEEPPADGDVARKWSTERLAGLFHWYRTKTIPMSPGERGCCASHLKAWKRCAASGKPLLVLEDDAVVLPCFTKTLEQALQEAPSDIGALWLTSKDRGTRKRVGKVIMQPSYLWTTVGYILWPRAARAFLRLLPMDMPVDNFMAWHVKEGLIKAFSVSPAVVRQAQTWNIGSDVPHSDDVALWDAE
eukprot:CAMPEP_0178422594 /NCGR_PEP_ID=MMETSP0689_2-20121128/27255_1 /TAXON_ID=160604 /ORGANISM="Amphidinium massartii, Strain CS-259" /LENGTH=260 /DNA_ID=CAMNT_0020044165 /DNA_START=110 /DNA_END=892 /DNA_ORIENTATION=-